MPESLIIDNVGFNVQAMAKLKEDEFVKLHLENDAICRHQDTKAKTKFLRDAYSQIKTLASGNGVGPETEPEKA